MPVGVLGLPACVCVRDVNGITLHTMPVVNVKHGVVVVLSSSTLPAQFHDLDFISRSQGRRKRTLMQLVFSRQCLILDQIYTFYACYVLVVVQ